MSDEQPRKFNAAGNSPVEWCSSIRSLARAHLASVQSIKSQRSQSRCIDTSLRTVRILSSTIDTQQFACCVIVLEKHARWLHASASHWSAVMTKIVFVGLGPSTGVHLFFFFFCRCLSRNDRRARQTGSFAIFALTDNLTTCASRRSRNTRTGDYSSSTICLSSEYV